MNHDDEVGGYGVPGAYGPREEAREAEWRRRYEAARSAAPAEGVQPVAPSGWKLVPIEPTRPMLHAGVSATYLQDNEYLALKRRWDAMLAAARDSQAPAAPAAPVDALRKAKDALQAWANLPGPYGLGECANYEQGLGAAAIAAIDAALSPPAVASSTISPST